MSLLGDVNDWQIFCSIFTILVMIIIIICYTILPELKNLHGLIFRSYLGTYIINSMFLFILQLSDFSKDCRIEFLFYAAFSYTGISMVLWINVMAFDIWKTFRVIKSTNIHIDESGRKKFICYAIYAWCIPVILGTINIGMVYNIRFLVNFDEYSYAYFVFVNYKFVHYCSGGILVTVFISNTFMFTWTTLRIKRLKNETSHLADGVNKHSKIHKQWFNLYLKLFIIMGGHLILWIIWIYWPNTVMYNVTATTDMIQVILTFFIFIWKQDVKRSFCKQLTKILYHSQEVSNRLHGSGRNLGTRLNTDSRELKFSRELNGEAISNIHINTIENVIT